MLRTLLLLTLAFTCASGFAQQSTLERYILSTGGQINDTLDNGTVVTLDLSTDDAEQENDEVDAYYDDDLDAGWEGAPEDQNLLTLGLRFTELNIPQGAEIDSAFIVLHAHEGKSAEDIAELTIVGELTANAITFDEDNFNEDYLLTDRPQTNAEVEWTVAEEWIIWQPYKTPDISPVVQEIVDLPDWEPGNAIAILLLPENQGPSIVENAREFTSFENIADPDDVDPQGNPGDGTNHPERRPYIQIYFQGTVSVAELSPDLFQLYPNPATDNTITLEMADAAPAQIEVVNLAGQRMKQLSTNSQRVQLDLTGLNAGVYMLQIVQGEKIAVQRIVVK